MNSILLNKTIERRKALEAKWAEVGDAALEAAKKKDMKKALKLSKERRALMDRILKLYKRESDMVLGRI